MIAINLNQAIAVLQYLLLIYNIAEGGTLDALAAMQYSSNVAVAVAAVTAAAVIK